MNARERMESGNEPCPQCGFKLITVEELITMLEKIENKKLPVMVSQVKTYAQWFSHVSVRADDKYCVYLNSVPQNL